MTDIELKRREAICEVAGIKDIGELSDGFHTFNSLYKQRMILFAALVRAYKDKAWKSYRHEDGEYCFGGGWFIVGIDTPEGSYTYHYENKYWDMFDCVDLPRSPHWDGHTESDAETRLMSLEPELAKVDNGNGDLIRRQMVLRCIKELRDNVDWGQSEDGDAFLHYTGTLYRSIASEECLPSVEQKRGEWIWSPKDIDGTVSGCCSNCSFSHLFIGGHTAQYNYCPNCGARMDERGEDDKGRSR